MARSQRKKDAEGHRASPFVVEMPAPKAVIEPMRELEPDGMDELRDLLEDLQSTVSELLARREAAPSAPDLPGSHEPDEPPASTGPGESTVPSAVDGLPAWPEPSSGDLEIDESSRILRFAQQTANSVVAAAREQALAIVADAERQRGEIIREAHRQAQQENLAERDRLETSKAALQAQRGEILDRLAAVPGVLAKHREEVEHLDAEVSAIADRLRSGFVAEPNAIGSVGGGSLAGGSVGGGSLGRHAVGVDPGADGGRRRNPFSRQPVSQVTAVDAIRDPFMFDVEDLPETAADLGWLTDGPADGATTF